MNNASTIKRVFFVGVLVLSHTISARHIPSLLYTDFCTASELTLVKEWQVRRSYIAIVRDKKGNEYIVKQAKEKLAAADMFAIRDAMGAWMAEELDIPANRVRIIPAGVAVPGKMYVDRPATIHRLIKNGIHYDIRMPKYMRTFMQRLQKTVKRIRQFSLRQEYGRAPRDQRGLTLRIIK
ncbi:MAG TPA: hypothetical protein VEK38_04310, partial [Candidatus Bathyarchaeia archaeon]|nr:hypothetical protein [Candidatus Bathyarchaeia archaeon]